MSLQVWLPMTKDLRQQGLSSRSITNIGATFSSNGKLGGCYIFDGTNDAIGIGDLSTLVETNFSFACWFYHDDTWSTKNYETILGGPSGFELEAKNGSTSSPVIKAYSWGSGSFAYELNKWNHLVMTRTSSETKFYLNGELKLTGTTGSIPSGDYFVGAWKTSTGQNYKGSICDVRIYDHCLSPMEVKRISQGLVLHYNLSDKEIEYTKNLVTVQTTATAESAVWGGHTVRWTVEDCSDAPIPINQCMKGDITYVAPASGTTGGTMRGIETIMVSPSTTYTYSAYIKATDDFTYTHPNFLYRHEYNSSGGQNLERGAYVKSQMEYYGDDWYRCYGTFTTADTTVKIVLQFYTYPCKSMIYYIGGWQFEEKDHLTPYVLGERKNSTIYDTSGYCNNGTITGDLIISEDTPKYSASTKFSGSEKITTASLPSEVKSVSFWVKVPTIPSGYGICYVDSGTQTSIGFYNGNSFITSCTVSANVVLLGTTFKANEWNHIVLVKTGTNTRNVYCNGVLLTSSGTNSWVHNGGNLSLGWRDYASGNAGWFNGQLCDFRAYATALSATDVKSLYQNTATIDADGTIHGAVR